MKQYPKPSVKEVIEQINLCMDYYGEVHRLFDIDEEFYELLFKGRLEIPTEFKASGIVLPTGRNAVDAFVDNINLTNARVSANKNGTLKMDVIRHEMMRKYYLGVLYANIVRSGVNPFRVSGKHLAMYGEGVLGIFWDADLWPDKPLQGDSEGEEEYAVRLDEWRAETHMSIPIVIRAVNPANILADPGQGGQLYVIEHQERTVFELRRRHPKWKGPLGGKGQTKVWCDSYFDIEWRCELVDREPVLRTKDGMVRHKYGFIPYTIMESGLGNLAKDGAPAKRYVGLLRYITDLLVSESRSYSLNDLVMARSALPFYTLEGDDAGAVTEISQRFGVVNKLPQGSKLTQIVPAVPPEALRIHLGITSDKIGAHAATRAVRGLSEEGVRSRVDRDAVISQGTDKYRYASEAFKHGVEDILIKSAMLFKNVIPGNVKVWAKTPADEMAEAVEIKKELMVEPFSCSIEFAPFSEDDAFRRHIDIIQLLKAGIYTLDFARGKMPDMDAPAVKRQELKEELRRSPAFQQIVQQYAAGRMYAAVATRSNAEVVAGVVPPVPQAPPPAQEGEESVGRPLIPTVQKVPTPAERIQAEMEKQRKGMAPFTGQGEGGGGNRW